MLENYCIKTFRKVVDDKEQTYIVLSRTYYNRNEGKYKEASSMFITPALAELLINNGIRLFDNAKLFVKVGDK